MTANIFIFTKEIDSALLISARATKFRPDAAMAKQFTIVPDSAGEREVQRAARKAATGPMAPPRNRHDTTGRQVDTAPKTGTPAFVWLKAGDSLVERLITTGLNNDTQVQVLSGLTTGDEVVNGIELEPSEGGSSGAVRSPFMPARRNNNSNNGSKPK
jgi:HlyD family secretion protein